jgi:hypothetical protein
MIITTVHAFMACAVSNQVRLRSESGLLLKEGGFTCCVLHANFAAITGAPRPVMGVSTVGREHTGKLLVL